MTPRCSVDFSVPICSDSTLPNEFWITCGFPTQTDHTFMFPISNTNYKELFCQKICVCVASTRSSLPAWLGVPMLLIDRDFECFSGIFRLQPWAHPFSDLPMSLCVHFIISLYLERTFPKKNTQNYMHQVMQCVFSMMLTSSLYALCFTSDVAT